MRYLAGALVGATIIVALLLSYDIYVVYIRGFYDSFMAIWSYLGGAVSGAIVGVVGVAIGSRRNKPLGFGAAKGIDY